MGWAWICYSTIVLDLFLNSIYRHTRTKHKSAVPITLFSLLSDYFKQLAQFSHPYQTEKLLSSFTSIYKYFIPNCQLSNLNQHWAESKPSKWFVTQNHQPKYHIRIGHWERLPATSLYSPKVVAIPKHL